jgi:hypothetical protein
MGARPSRSLLEILRSTAEKVELNSDLASDDPAVVEFKRSIMLSIAELEVTASSAPPEMALQTDNSLPPKRIADPN